MKEQIQEWIREAESKIKEVEESNVDRNWKIVSYTTYKIDYIQSPSRSWVISEYVKNKFLMILSEYLK